MKAIEAGREAIRQREEADPAHPQGGSAEPEPPVAVNDADALMEVAEGALVGNGGVRSAGERHQVVIHADAEALAGADGAAGCRIDDGPAICAETARRLACDDGCCQFPGCENRRWVDAHHIVHWARGGQTRIDNLVLLCSHHHRLVHEGGFSLGRLRDGTLAFRRPDGRRVPPVPSPLRGSAGGLRSRNRRAGLEILPLAAMPLGRGEPFDRELAVEGLLARAGP